MAGTEELEARLREIGSRLASPPCGVDELLSLLNVNLAVALSFCSIFLSNLLII